jgi:predicted TIM-barrel fold metal-dependent hydrolase
MYLHPDHPSKATILAARDHVLAMNPKLRVVGAHLGSMETSVDEMARHFDRYPNFAVDTAARVEYFARQPREKVRAFLIKYQDRVVYGTDLELHKTDDTQEAIKEWEETYVRDYRFFATDQTVDFHHRKAQGLNLPPAVVRNIFHQNAVRWIPGVMPRSE